MGIGLKSCYKKLIQTTKSLKCQWRDESKEVTEEPKCSTFPETREKKHEEPKKPFNSLF